MAPHWTVKYIGAPYRVAEYGPDAYDCYGLIVAVYREQLGIQLPEYLLEEVGTLLKVGRLVEKEETQPHWRHVSAFREFDVVELANNRRTFHVGLIASVGKRLQVLHALENMGAILTPVTRLKTTLRMRITKGLRHVATD